MDYSLKKHRDVRHPTNKDWFLFDVLNPEHPRPPRNCSLLLINPGGSLIIGSYQPWVRYWGFKPRIPKTEDPRVSLHVSINGIASI